MALVYRKYIIRRDKFDWEDEEEEDETENTPDLPEEIPGNNQNSTGDIRFDEEKRNTTF